MPFFPISGYRDCVASSTVSLKASEGEWPFARSTSYCAAKAPWMAPIRMPRSPYRSDITSFLNVVSYM